jgi:hypothetical protein
MIQVAPQMRILVAIDPVDFRGYVELAVMRSPDPRFRRKPPRSAIPLGSDSA